ncbi:MAG: hypothetical protein AAFR79_07935 [Pseudomonadota bacterium]
MALSIRRDSSLNAAPEALVFADGFPELESLADQLDQEFGVDQWIEVSHAQADQALAQLGGNTAYAVVTASADVPEAI